MPKELKTRTTVGGLQQLEDEWLGEHVILVCEEWNEPDKYDVGESVIIEGAGYIQVNTPIDMRYEGQAEPSRCVAAATYNMGIAGPQLAAMVIFNGDGLISYAVPGNHNSRRSVK